MVDVSALIDQGTDMLTSRIAKIRTRRRVCLRSVHALWQRAVAFPEARIIILSPYLTSTAEDVLNGAWDPSTCRIFTLFEAKVFATGSSSLQTLRHLAELGVRLHSLPGVHAKMVLVEGRFASVGSQNLTANGKLSKEATFFTTASDEVDRIWKRTEEWLGESCPITVEMIDDMEVAIVDLAEQYKQFEVECVQVDTTVLLKQEQRRQAILNAEARRMAEQQLVDRERGEAQEAEARESRKIIAENWSRVGEKSLVYVSAKVHQDWNEAKAEFRHVLKVEGGADLTSWTLEGGREIELERLHRYPCMVEESWRFGFARIARSRISFVETSLLSDSPIEVDGRLFHVNIESNWKDQSDGNLKFILINKLTTQQLAFPAWFQLRSVQLGDAYTPSNGSGYDGDNFQWFVDRKNEIAEELLKLMLLPFVYERALTGKLVESFFGAEGSRVILQVALIGEAPIIVARLV